MPIVPAAQRLIDRLGLEPHPEGGFYRETYRSEERIHRGVPAVERTACTAIRRCRRPGWDWPWCR